MCTHTGDQQRERGSQLPHTFNLSRVGGTHHQAQLAIQIPWALGQFSNVFVQQRLAFNRGQTLVLQIVTAGVGGATQQESAFAVVLQIGRHRVPAHEGRQGHGVGAVALKSFFGVLLGRAANVTALGVQNDRHMRGHAANMFHQAFELAFGAVRGKVSDLRLEAADQVGCGVHDGGAKVVDLVGIAFVAVRKFGGFGVQAHAKHGAVLALGGAQHVKKGHAEDFKGRPASAFTERPTGLWAGSR